MIPLAQSLATTKIRLTQLMLSNNDIGITPD
jgi:hypothetical protein